MFYNAKNNNIKIEQSNMDYVSFGVGNKNLIIIPGLGDGLRTVKGMAVSLAFIVVRQIRCTSPMQISCV